MKQSKFNKVKAIIIRKNRVVSIKKAYLDGSTIYDKRKTFACDVTEKDMLILGKKVCYIIHLDSTQAVAFDMFSKNIIVKTPKTAQEYGLGLRSKILSQVLESVYEKPLMNNLFMLIIGGLVIAVGILTYFLNNQIIEKLNEILKFFGN